jgi:hypothetical protein
MNQHGTRVRNQVISVAFVDEVTLGQVFVGVLRISHISIIPPLPHIREPGSSVCIVSGYGLDDRAIDVRAPAEAKGFFL